MNLSGVKYKQIYKYNIVKSGLIFKNLFFKWENIKN